ncbi:MAG: tetratricopeptide repeat protein [Candidatus Hydrogenedens sp.]|jgi:tetratricopeptide (TPR) repeat protein|nr:tetratricopeptide repeat protein [Candidatus Hydrogenedens sp.]
MNAEETHFSTVLRRLTTATLLLVLCLAGAACRRAHDPEETLLIAWKLCEALHYEEAYPLIVENLQKNPDDAVAHYLLGRCFFTQKPPQLTRAKGEYDQARQILEDSGNMSILDGKMTPDEFRATLHCDTALTLLQTVVEAEKAGMPPRAALGVLKTACHHVEEGLHYNPGSSFLQDLNQTLQHMLRFMESPEVTPEKETQPFFI